MKKLILFFFFIYTFSCLANEQDTIKIVEYDSLSAISKNSAKDGFDFIVSGGLGIATGSSADEWEDTFNPGPALTIGMEIPLLSDNSLSLIITGHFIVASIRSGFIADSLTIYEYYKDYLQSTYLEISKDIYAQLGLSTGIGFHVFEFKGIDKNLSFRGSISYYLLNPGSHYHPFNLGEADTHLFNLGLILNYQLNKTLDVSLSRIINFIGFGYPREDIPNLLMLNICYKFKW